ncbi:MAG TPA: hypothetical protein VJR87_08600 [Allosphingosinicella sp.]|nr:hypothetical protein [Allosphingosinicella sp.]
MVSAMLKEITHAGGLQSAFAYVKTRAPLARQAFRTEVAIISISRHQRRIGGMATMPTRAHCLPAVLADILPQLDRLYLFFDRHDAVPRPFSDHPKIVPLLPADHGDLAGSGKFLGVGLESAPCRYFCFDDDIRYPADYVDYLNAALELYGFEAVVGIHGADLRPPYRSYLGDRIWAPFGAGLAADRHVDILGTGTCAFQTGRFRFDPRAWPHTDMCDLLLSIDAAREGLPRIALKRYRNYLSPIEQVQKDSVFSALIKDDSRQTLIMRDALPVLCRRGWREARLGAPTEIQFRPWLDAPRL